MNRPTHVFLIFVDHFEPDYDAGLVERWAARYRALAARHADASGRPPQHTFFYAGDQSSLSVLAVLRTLTAAGLGEVEMHYHHAYDTEEGFRQELAAAIADFQEFGFLKTVTGETRFAFIHGNSGLDNSSGPQFCGVNSELRLLHDMGCFADFTFPSVFEDAQPPIVNSIYAAQDDSGPKSYAKRLPLTALAAGRADLMIFEGPLIFTPSFNLRHLFLDLDDGDIHPSIPASPARADRWVQADVHVPQRPDWVFIKLFTHGASSDEDEDVVLGPTFDETLTYLERHYNDGHRYVLHYITAREAYNLVRAAVAGEKGDPDRYLDWIVPPYLANPCRRPSPPDLDRDPNPGDVSHEPASPGPNPEPDPGVVGPAPDLTIPSRVSSLAVAAGRTTGRTAFTRHHRRS